MEKVVENLEDTMQWILTYGSGHTEAIICLEDSPDGEGRILKESKHGLFFLGMHLYALVWIKLWSQVDVAWYP